MNPAHHTVGAIAAEFLLDPLRFRDRQRPQLPGKLRIDTPQKQLAGTGHGAETYSQHIVRKLLEIKATCICVLFWHDDGVAAEGRPQYVKPICRRNALSFG